MEENSKPGKTIDPKTIREKIMNPSIPKSESEWWAKMKIESLEQKFMNEIGQEHNKSELDKYIPFINQGKEIERNQWLKTINEEIEKAKNIQLPNKKDRGYWTVLTTKETRINVLKDLKEKSRNADID